MSRDHILHKVRTAIDRNAGQTPAEPPPVMLKVPEMGMDERIERFSAALEKLSGKAHIAASPEAARMLVEELIAGQSAVASNAAYLRECGVASLPGVFTGFTELDELREACATSDVGISSADYILADTGSLVTLASPEEARLVSLLPPIHIAVVPRDRILTGLDELFTRVPNPAEVSSSMVLITGPSRTADIEQILIKGVHGPGMVHAVIV
jgi:L-lactate dehydrogenase complex protein LldG